jgi:hypothetical protein
MLLCFRCVSLLLLLRIFAPVVPSQLGEHPQQQWARLLPVHWDGRRQLLLGWPCRTRQQQQQGSNRSTSPSVLAAYNT